MLRTKFDLEYTTTAIERIFRPIKVTFLEISLYIDEYSILDQEYMIKCYINSNMCNVPTGMHEG